VICLLCPSSAVTDCLCVECGAKLWAARYLLDAERNGTVLREDDVKHPEQFRALRYLEDGETERARAEWRTPRYDLARGVLIDYQRARQARAEAPVCSRGCKTHDET
jgi:hypothetical protein